MTREGTTPSGAPHHADGASATASATAEVERRRGPAARIDGLDLARFLALAGMMCTHLWLYGPNGVEPALSAAFAGKASALFAVLAGVGIVLTSRRDLAGGDARRARLNLLGRGLALIVLGLALGTVSFFILVILAYYGVMFLLLIPFVGRRSGTLLGFAAAWAVVWPFCSHGLRLLLGDELTGGGPVGLFHVLAPHRLVIDLLLTGTYPAITWMTYGLVGMAIGTMLVARMAPRIATATAGATVPATAAATPIAATGEADARAGASGRAAAPAGLGVFGTWLALTGAAVALVALFIDELLVRFVYLPEAVSTRAEAILAINALRDNRYGTTPTDSLWNLLSTGPHTGTPFDLFITSGVAAATIGACLALMSVLGRAGRTALMPVLGAGAAPLTVYTVHVLITTATWLVYQSIDAGPPAATWWVSSWMIWVVHLALALAIGATLRVMNQRGPFERFVTASGRATARIGKRSSGPDHRVDQPSPSSST